MYHMNDTVKTILFILLVIILGILAFKIVAKALPVLLIIGLVIVIFFAVKSQLH